MANAGVYLAVARNDSALPVIVHNSIQENTDEGRQKCMNQAWDLFQATKGRIPFHVVEIHSGPAIDHRIIKETSPNMTLQTPEEQEIAIGKMGKNLTRPQTAVPNLRSFSEEHRVEAVSEATDMGRGVRMEIHSSHTEYYATTEVKVGHIAVWYPPTYKGQLIYEMTLIDPRQPYTPKTWRSPEFQTTMDIYAREHAAEYADVVEPEFKGLGQ